MSEKFTKEPWHIAVIKNIGEGRIVWDKINEPDLQLIADAWQLPDLRRENAELKAINKELEYRLSEMAIEVVALTEENRGLRLRLRRNKDE